MSFTASRISRLATASDLPQQLAGALEQGGSRRLARTRMSPEMSYGRHAGPPPATARAAAVMLLLFRRGGRWYLPLTVRPASLDAARRAGQPARGGR